MAEEVTFITPGFKSEKDAWTEAGKYTVDTNSTMKKARSLGMKVSVGVRRKGNLWYVVIIKRT